MSPRTHNPRPSKTAPKKVSAARPTPRGARPPRIQAGAFAALGDQTRLSLVGKLSHGRPCSIAQLTHGSHLTRQAITKHLRVLERARIVRCVRSGRHALFELDPEPVHALRDYLNRISTEWDQALARLKSFVET